ncbi:MAG TPA: threonine ammonia-lyase [Polyangiales bacterium]|nr:threonine ammonia-lyase [Polyangiales bacterium]
MIGLTEILAARERISSFVRLTACARSERLSRLHGADVFLKLESLQSTGSFKERGALNKLLQLSAAERAAGVIAASAGNHAQGLSRHARVQGIACTIVMPTNSPLVKVTATRGYGAEVVLHGDNYEDAAKEVERLRAERGLTLVHAFDDDAVIAGQGSIGLELLEQVPNLQAVVVPVGGGGLAGGVATAIKTQRPDIAVYGVETQLVPSMQRALELGTPCVLPAQRSLADGINTRRVCERTLEIAQRYLDGVISVDESEISEAVLRLLEGEKIVAEGAGAVSLAGLLTGRLPLAGKCVAVVVSGGNIDVNLLSRIIERGLMKSGRSMRVRVVMPDLPGTLARLLATIASEGANVIAVQHDRVAARTEVGGVAVDVVLETRGFEHVAAVEAALRSAGWELESLHAIGPALAKRV